jgi:hypothetical protein
MFGDQNFTKEYLKYIYPENKNRRNYVYPMITAKPLSL